MSNHQSIIVLGDVNVDLVMPIARYPLPGQEATSRELVSRCGGSAANTAIVLARLGLRPRLIGRTGTDPWGELARRTLGECGVDCERVQQDGEHPTGITFVPALPGGEHSMFCFRGANDYTDPALVEESIFEDAALLHISGYALANAPQREAAARAIELAARYRVPVSLDTALEPALRLVDEMRWLLPQLALCVLGREEAHALTGANVPDAAAAALHRAGVELVGVKLGADGCLLSSGKESIHLPAFQVPVVDTTGAGDSFSAGLIFGRLSSCGTAPSAIIAAALGALAATAWGAGSALPGRHDLIRFLQSQLSRQDEDIPVAEALAAVENASVDT